MKKLFSCLTAGLLAVQGLTPGAFAEAHAAIAVGSCEAMPGETFELPVEIQENPGIAALSISLVYDSSKLELLGTQDGKILGESSYLAGNDLTAVPYTMNWDDLTDNTGTGNVVLLSFKAKDDASGTTEVSALVNTQSTFNANMEEIPFMTESGYVTFGTGEEHAPVIRAGTVQASAGGEAAVPVYLGNNPGVAALSLSIAYDNRLTLLGAEDGKILGTSIFTAGNDLSANPYTLNWDDLGEVNNTGSGTAAVIRFKVPEDAEGTLPVKISLNQKSTFNMDMEDVVFQTAEGAVIVTPETEPAVTTAAAPAGAEVIVDTVTASVGDTVGVPVRLKNNPGIAALSLHISYDTTKLKLVSAADGKILGSSAFLAGNDLTAVPYKLNWDDLGEVNNTGNGIVATLRFKVLKAGKHPVSVTVDRKSTFNADMEDVSFAAVNGAVDATGIVTTAKPVTTTAKPVTTTAKPVTSSKTTTAAVPAGAEVIVDTVTASVGDTVGVPVRLKNNPGVAALSLHISYDTTKLKLVSAADGKILGSSAFLAGNDLTAVPYKLNWDDLGEVNNTGNGIVATLRFKVLKAGKHPVSVTVDQKSTFNADMEEVSFAAVNGAVDATGIVTTAKPVTTTAKPVTTTAKPVTSSKTTTAAAPAGAEVIVDTVTASVGDTVGVPVRLKNNPGVAALSLHISYDTTKLKLVSAADGKILGSSAFLAGNDLTAVPYKLNWDDLGEVNNTGNGIVATLRFKVLKAGKHPVSVTVDRKSTFNADMEEVSFAAVNGAVDATGIVTTAKPVTTTAKPVTSSKTTTAAAPAGGEVIVDTVTASVGDTVGVPVRLKNNPGVAALSLHISYDTTKLKLVSAADGKILGSSAFLAGNDLTAVPYKLNWDDLGEVNNTGNGIVATLRFKVLKAGKHPVTVTVDRKSTFNADMEEVSFAAVNGAVDATGIVTTAKPVTTTAKPVTTTAKPVTTTAKPVTTTAKPVTTTAKPVTTTAKPVTTTAKPVITTAKPVTTTAKPVTTTAKPVTTTAKPVTTTAKPVTTTVKPVTITAKPVTTTAKPVTTTAKPVTTTAKPVTTTAKPVTTTAKPVTTTAKPVTTTAKPVTTTAKPVTTTAKPVTTTAKPITTTAKPITTTAMPVTTTAKPVTTTAKPVTTTAKPVTTTAKPVTTTAKPVTTTAMPVTTTAKPVTTTAKPVTTTAKPVTTTAKPVTTTAKPVTTTAKPVTTTAKPVTTTAKPVTTTAKPVTTTAKPVTTTAKPVTTTAKPVTTTAKPVTTTAKPVTTTAKPVTTTAVPVTTTEAPVTTTEPVTTTVPADAAALAVDTVEAKIGETVKVPIRLRNNPGITALSFDVSYDRGLLKLVSVEDGRILGSSTFLSGNDLTLIPYTLNWDDAASVNNTGNGIVATLEFEVLAEGSADIALKLNQKSTFNVNFDEIAFAAVNGAVQAVPAEAPGKEFLRGDIDLNGEVSVEDAQFALKVYTERISGKTPSLTADALRNGDVNEDGILSVEDVQFILMYYVNNTVAGKKLEWEALIPTLNQN